MRIIDWENNNTAGDFSNRHFTNICTSIINIIIINNMVFSLALPIQNKFDLRRVKKTSYIQYSNRKWGTHEWVFSKTLAHVYSKNEIS